MFDAQSGGGLEPLRIDNVVPHYQPIINTINRSILGYEVLGRFQDPGSTDYKSLGAFFHGKSNLYQKVRIDRIIREKAIRHLKSSGIHTKLFFNVMPKILSHTHPEESFELERFHLVQLIDRYEVNRNDIIIEITEDEFTGRVEKLIEIVENFRRFGFKIAVDDAGSGFSNLERIGYIHPDIIKVDIKIMRESLSKNSFRQVLTAISKMSEKLGSELLFEGIESERELNLALGMGANLLQGFYFSEALDDFQKKDHFAIHLKSFLEKFSGLHFLQILDEFKKQEGIIERLSGLFEALEKEADSKKDSHPEILRTYLSILPKEVTQIFISDLHGYQLSSTFIRNEDSWDEVKSDLGNNHAWRPYFIKHKAESFHFHKKWGVTEPLYNKERQKEYVIFTFAISENRILVTSVDWN